LITGIALPTDGVVYVQNYTLPSGNPAPVVNDGATPCFNPYQYAQPADSAECLEGDAYVEGELRGDLTVASAANIIVTRDLTYQCADGSGGASSTDPSSVSLCTTENNPDVIGLSAKYDILVSHNDSSVNIENTQDCINHGFGDGTGTPANVKGGTFGGTVINGTYYANDPAAVWPSVCDPTNIVIDAAVFGLNGSFGVENWDTSPYSQYVNLNGTDLSEYRGPFGISGSDGYEKNFSYDSRLAFLAPPYVIPGSVPLWLVQDYVVCPSTSCPPT
jgi:hypothetical protein